jgi:hypothetical protein
MATKKYVPEGNTKAEKRFAWIMIAVGAVVIPYLLLKGNAEAQKRAETKLALEQAGKQ